jgi:anti-sigma regulatory factor (Ser/Thr protein kinase)
MQFTDINNDYNSYAYLVDFYHQNQNKSYGTIDISFKNVKWIAANTCSLIGALFQKLQNSFNTIKIWEMSEPLRDILSRNGFLAFLGYERIFDHKYTTIQYLKLNPKDSRFFSEYIREDLLGKKSMPTMSDRLKKKITEGIYEIFINAVMHSETKEGIFTCGQLFPKKNTIEFMITDLGIGIRNRVSQYLKKSLSSVDAIEWAMKERNTTKQNDSGGVGLAILKRFIALNKGKIQILSGNGFWEFSEKGTEKQSFDYEFPGTAVNIGINTNDQAHYRLWEEMIEDENIF